MIKCCERTNSKTKYKPLCKKSSSIEIANQYYCWIHAKKKFSQFCTIIQKIYRGHYYRRKLQRLFINLPHDCQQIVLFHLKRSVYYDLYIRTIQNILTKKYNEYMNIWHSIRNYYYHQDHIINLKHIHNVYSAFNTCKKCAPVNIYDNLYCDIKNNLVIRRYLRYITNLGKPIGSEINILLDKIQVQENIMLYGYDRHIAII